jgi:hypothetical protein
MGSKSRMPLGAIMLPTVRVPLCAEGIDGTYDGMACLQCSYVTCLKENDTILATPDQLSELDSTF